VGGLEIVLLSSSCLFLHEVDLKEETVFLHLSEFGDGHQDRRGMTGIYSPAIHFRSDLGRKAKTPEWLWATVPLFLH